MLPKIDYPIIDIEFKSLKNSKIKFRPMLVKDEKILLIAKESNSDVDIFTAVKQVVTNCCLDDKFDINKIPLFELEYAFLFLRMQSINNIIELSYHDNEDEKDYKFTINLSDINIIYPEKKVDNKIQLTDDGVGIVLLYPPASLYSNDKFLNSKGVSDSFDEILHASIEQIYDRENVYDIATTSKEELNTFLESIDSKSYKKIQEFFENVPYMEHIIKYKNGKGTDRTISLRTLNDFFIL